jgi:hypothetical protein
MQNNPTYSAAPLILGGSGKLGQALARIWPAAAPAPLWQYRPWGAPLSATILADRTLAWDILHAPSPTSLPPLGGIIALAGVTAGSDTALADNTALALAAAALGLRLGVPVLVASSQAVYGAQAGALSEEAPLLSLGGYGAAKVAMEAALAGMDHVTCLRIGNVAGCDMLFGRMHTPPVMLDQFADGLSTRRAYLGPADLAQVLLALLAAPQRPAVLNVARPRLVAMADLVTASGVYWHWQRAPDTALPVLALDVDLQQIFCPLPPADAQDLLAQARAAGWRA